MNGKTYVTFYEDSDCFDFIAEVIFESEPTEELLEECGIKELSQCSEREIEAIRMNSIYLDANSDFNDKVNMITYD